jgi:hypothetical protein
MFSVNHLLEGTCRRSETNQQKIHGGKHRGKRKEMMNI